MIGAGVLMRPRGLTGPAGPHRGTYDDLCAVRFWPRPKFWRWRLPSDRFDPILATAVAGPV